MLSDKFYDLIIVGAGFAGSIVAANIARKGVNPASGERLKIAMIEGGPYFKGKPKWGYGIPSRRQMFTHIPQDMRQGDRSGRIRDGRVFKGVGGGSIQWGAKGHPPEDKDYEWWARETGVDWTKENMKEAVHEILRIFNSHTVPDKLLQEYHFRFRDAAQSMGYKTEKILVHLKNCIFCGAHYEFEPQCRYDAKVSTLLTHIPIAEENGVEILPNTKVEQVIIEKRGSQWVATGVWYREKGGTPEKAEAKKIIVACENVGTPLLMYASGYGPKDLLGDKLIVENANVGSHGDGQPGPLVDPVTARFEDLVVHEAGDGNFGFWFLDDKDSKGSDRLFVLSGAETTGNNFFGAHSYALSEWAPEFGHKHKGWMRSNWKNWRHIVGNPFYLAPLVAYSHISTASPRARIFPDGSVRFDHEYPTVQKRLKECRDLLHALFEKMGAKEIRDNPKDRVGSTGGSSGGLLHDVGFCRAGQDRTNSVINSNFECHDIANLFIVDSSTHPRCTSLWSGGTVVAVVATFAAGRIIANHFKR